jgi:O-antigen ligase
MKPAGAEAVSSMPGPAIGRARARLAALGAPRIEANVVLAVAVILMATMLFQRPFFEIGAAGGSRQTIRAWDLAWLALVATSLPLMLRSRRRLPAILAWRRPSALSLYAAFAALAVVSLAWEFATFGSDGFAGAVVRALRLAAVAWLAVALRLIWSDRVARILTVALIVTTTIAAALALHAWWFATTPDTGLGVTRAGGPFGNYFADGTSDRSWAFPAASSILGYWLAVTMVVIVDRLFTGRAGRETLVRVLLACALLICAAALVATHSRESWVAAAVGCAVWVVASRRGLSTRSRWAIAGFASVGLVAVVLLVPSFRDRLVDTFDPGSFAYTTGPAARVDAWKEALRIGFDRPVTGWGVGGVEEHAARFGGGTAENVFLQSFMALGIPGALLLVGVVVTAVRSGFRRLSAGREAAGMVFGLSILGLLAVHGLFGNTLGDPTVQVLVGCALAAASIGVPLANEPADQT